jgi:hypothetical protein
LKVPTADPLMLITSLRLVARASPSCCLSPSQSRSPAVASRGFIPRCEPNNRTYDWSQAPL